MSLALALAAFATSAGAAYSSEGCGGSPPTTPGKTSVQSINVAGLDRSYLLRVPKSYDSSKAYPLIISHHGWGGTSSSDERGSGLSDIAEQEGFIVAFLQGWADNPNRGSWGSWNGAGTVNSTAQKPGCLSWGGTKSYCYTSCKNRDGPVWDGCDSVGCDWTTCVDSTEFNVAVLDKLESQLCVDTTREYATGQSNGAMQTFWLGSVLSERLAAVAPISGSFQNGYIKAPVAPIPMMDVTGTQDTVVPINDTTYGNGPVSSEGWIYELMTNIFAAWEPANGCTGKDKVTQYKTPLDDTYKLYCWGKKCGAGGSAPVIRCAWDGGHNYFGNSGEYNAPLVWSFLSRYSKPSHIGKGVSRGKVTTALVPESERRATAVPAPRRKSANVAPLAVDPEVDVTRRNKRPYGNPKNGCMEGESVISFGTGDKTGGRTCAPLRKRGQCKAGGYRQKHNGCPAGPQGQSAVFSTCLAKARNASAAVGSEFHCFLACDRAATKTDPDPDADSACPPGATCMAGHLRFDHVGICVY